MTPSNDDKGKSGSISEPTSDDEQPTIPINDSNYQQSESSFLVSSLSSQPSISVNEHNWSDLEETLRLKHSDYHLLDGVNIHYSCIDGENPAGPALVLLH